MASPGIPRHSKKDRTSVTIELAPEEVVSASEAQDANRAELERASEASPVVEPGPADQQEPPQKPSEAASPSTRGFSGFGAGLAGGALALLGGAALQWGGVLPTFGGAETSALRQEIAVLKENSGNSAVDQAVLDALTSGQETLTKGADALATEIAAVRESQKSLAGEIAALGSSAAPINGDLSALTEKVAQFEARVNALENGGASAKIAALESRLAVIDKRSGESSGAANVAQAIAAAGLKAAIDRGGSFANELETFATVSPASPELEQLRNLAAAGVPSKAELSAEFGKAADAMLAAARPADPDAGLIAQLVASARSMVRSRPVGDVEGDSPEAVVARMESALNKGDLDAALAEAAKLPDAPRAAGIDYINRLTARRDTDALVTKALTSALSASGDPK